MSIVFVPVCLLFRSINDNKRKKQSFSPETVSVTTSLHSVEEYKSHLRLPIHLQFPLLDTDALTILYSLFGGTASESGLLHSYSHSAFPPPSVSHLTVMVSPLNVRGQFGLRVTTTLFETVHKQKQIINRGDQFFCISPNQHTSIYLSSQWQLHHCPL